MQFNDTSNKNGHIQLCEQILFGDNGFGKISGNTNLLAIFTNNINTALDWYSDIAIKNDWRWSFDPSTYTTRPEGYTNLYSGQSDYTLDVDWLEIESVEALDSTGTVWIPLQPISLDEIKASGYAVGEYASTSGTPNQYRKEGNSIILLPATNYDMTDGLKIILKRGSNYFATSDTTKESGIPQSHARFINDYACWLYARDRLMAIANGLLTHVRQYEQTDIPEHYSKRSGDEQKIIKYLKNVRR